VLQSCFCLRFHGVYQRRICKINLKQAQACTRLQTLSRPNGLLTMLKQKVNIITSVNVRVRKKDREVVRDVTIVLVLLPGVKSRYVLLNIRGFIPADIFSTAFILYIFVLPCLLVSSWRLSLQLTPAYLLHQYVWEACDFISRKCRHNVLTLWNRSLTSGRNTISLALEDSSEFLYHECCVLI
jgi:hypothetical protein